MNNNIVDVYLTQKQIEKTEEIANVLGIAIGVTLNSAIKYAVNKKAKIKNGVKGTEAVSVKITEHTLFVLRSNGHEEHLNNVLTTGIDLLYRKLV